MRKLLPLLFLFVAPLAASAAEKVTIGKVEAGACAPYSRLPLMRKVLAEAKTFNSLRDRLNAKGVSIEISRRNFQAAATQVGEQVQEIRQEETDVASLLCAALKPAEKLEQELLPDAMSGMTSLGEFRSVTKGKCSEQLQRAAFMLKMYQMDYAGGCAP